MATVTITINSLKTKTHIFAAKNQEVKDVEAALLYHPMERLSGNGLILVVVFAKLEMTIALNRKIKPCKLYNFSLFLHFFIIICSLTC